MSAKTPWPRCASMVAGILLTLVAAVPATGASQTREPAPLPDLIEDESCGFLVEVTFPVNDEYAITLTDNDGGVTRVIIVGRLVVTFTNPDSGESVTANISGPSHIDFVRGTNTQEGLIGGPVGTLPGLSLVAGHLDLLSGDLRGHVFADVCALLA
jgi:hypothetical protein